MKTSCFRKSRMYKRRLVTGVPIRLASCFTKPIQYFSLRPAWSNMSLTWPESKHMQHATHGLYMDSVPSLSPHIQESVHVLQACCQGLCPARLQHVTLHKTIITVRPDDSIDDLYYHLSPLLFQLLWSPSKSWVPESATLREKMEWILKRLFEMDHAVLSER